jgi:hypothetical protein
MSMEIQNNQINQKYVYLEPTLDVLEKTLYHYYDEYGECYWFFTWQEAYRFLQRKKLQYMLNFVNNYIVN